MEIGNIITFDKQNWIVEDIKRIDDKKDMLILSKTNFEPIETDLLSITDQPCQCPECNWNGIVWDCESDGETGDLLCPECLVMVEVQG